MLSEGFDGICAASFTYRLNSAMLAVDYYWTTLGKPFAFTCLAEGLGGTVPLETLQASTG